MITNSEVPSPSAIERLETSRALLLQAMRNTLNDSTPPGVQKTMFQWLSSLKNVPVMTVLVEAISSWWIQNPLRVVGLLATNTTRALVQHLAQRNPLGLAVGVLALGIFIAWRRPWRWILKPAIFAGLGSHLWSKGIAHLSLKS